MRHLIACLSSFALLACTPAASPWTEPDPLDAVRGAQAALHPAAGTGFVAVSDDRGPAWAWRQDPTLRVLLSSDPGAPGLLVTRGERSLSVATDLGQGPVDLPVLLVFQRADGTEPLAADPSPGLHLLLAGSPEHGCPVDALELDLLPRRVADGVALDVHISGIPYLALPPQGALTVAGADGATRIDAADHVEAAGDLQVAGFRWLLAEGGPLGTLSLRAAEPLPWFQLQGHSGLVEVDMDHSCEADAPVTRAELDLAVVL